MTNKLFESTMRKRWWLSKKFKEMFEESKRRFEEKELVNWKIYVEWLGRVSVNKDKDA